jgi:hypothetical protein
VGASCHGPRPVEDLEEGRKCFSVASPALTRKGRVRLPGDPPCARGEMDIITGFYPDGWGFESSRAHCAGAARWSSVGFPSRKLRVRVPSPAPCGCSPTVGLLASNQALVGSTPIIRSTPVSSKGRTLVFEASYRGSSPCTGTHWGVDQLVGQQSLKLPVGGSIPPAPTTCRCGATVALLPCKQGVVGSIPTIGSELFTRSSRAEHPAVNRTMEVRFLPSEPTHP